MPPMTNMQSSKPRPPTAFTKRKGKNLHVLIASIAVLILQELRANDHPTAPVEALRDGASKVVYGKEAVQAFADHLAQVYEGGHQVPEDLIANIPSMPAASVAAPWQHAPPHPHLPPPSIRTTRAAAAAAALVTNVGGMGFIPERLLMMMTMMMITPCSLLPASSSIT